MFLFLSILAVICGAAGIIGAVLPVVPGPALSYFGMLCAYWTDTSTLTSGKMWLWGVVTAVVTALDYILPAYFSKMFGGSRAGIIGATVGVFAGMILLGPWASSSSLSSEPSRESCCTTERMPTKL